MTAETQENIRNFVEGVAVAAITAPSKRDKQEAPGPSDLASKCDVCVANSIASYLGRGEKRRNGFSLKAWVGTAVHEKLERDLPLVYPRAEREIEVKIGDIPGIGPVVGHIDTFFPEKQTVNDWKTADLKNIQKYKTQAGPGAYTLGLTVQERAELENLKERDRLGTLAADDVNMFRLISLMARTEEHSGGVPIDYIGQTMLYLLGLRRMGREAKYATLTFIPRDSNNLADIWVTSCEYRPEVAEGVLRRATHLARVVQAGRVADLEPHPECFPCVIRPRLSR
ncbi:hypothetical protein [Streptomyces cucumeris]|uniref:hypothetical protein n=1 Tax=Streptomyces cucumeris TaxID=2962890 RepID=UPI0020C8FD2B|nr:hypothetical protein [Streptomyces sp. NEAU-Y11]MCP9209702.1 hypothetical protein [Streptomyces sp. NEAU-Y11]